jgi:predicted amidohydrolase
MSNKRKRFIPFLLVGLLTAILFPSSCANTPGGESAAQGSGDPGDAPGEDNGHAAPGEQEPADEPFVIRVATTGVKLRLGNKNSNLEAILRLMDKAAESAPDIIVLSESVFTRMNSAGFDRNGIVNTGNTGHSELISGPVFTALKEKAVEYGSYIAFNINAPYGDDLSAIYNSNFLISPEGEIVGRFDKNVLPGDEVRAGLARGFERPVFDIEINGRTVRVGMAICADFARDAYEYAVDGEEYVAQTLAENGAEIILFSTIGDFKHEAVYYAERFGVYIVVAGQDKYLGTPYATSGVVGPGGEILLAFSDRTGLESRWPEMQYRAGEDGSWGYADITIER